MIRIPKLSDAEFQPWVAKTTAPGMFWLALAFLVCQAVLVVLWVDVPNLQENAILTIAPDDPNAESLRQSLSGVIVDHHVQDAAIYTMLVIWPMVIGEAVYHWIVRPWNAVTRRFHLFGLLFCICPSLRLCARSPEMGYRLWLPKLGWRIANRKLRARLQRQFSVPMIVIAMMIMPLLIIEFFLKDQVAQYRWLRMLLHFGTGVIWFAFAAEFILMVSVAEKKIAYCKKHWIDLAIIVLPLFSFLRSLRVLRASQALRVPQLTKLARVYRLRGTAVKALRALVLLELFQRFINKDADRSIAKLQSRLDELEEESKQIRRQIIKLQREKAEQERDRIK